MASTAAASPSPSNARDAAVAGLFEALEDLDKRLASQRFLGGDKFSWLDLRLYHTLRALRPGLRCLF